MNIVASHRVGGMISVLRSVVISVIVLSTWSASAESARPLKVLHVGFHKGCLNDIEEVARELSVDVTSWYILAAELPREHFDGITRGNGVYNITHERAQRVWEKHKDYFNQFDVIMTSDTAPLARIFLQNNNWKKPLIIWICNRFDYTDYGSLDGAFPDQEFYNLFRAAAHKKNVHIISYTPYEHHYARARGVEIGTHVIRPIGVKAREVSPNFTSAIPSTVKKAETVFLYPRLELFQVQHIQQKCAHAGINLYHGAYNGPDDLVGFKGVLYFPYAWSNLALFENLQRGIVHFVPTERFVIDSVREGKPIKHFTFSHFQWCDWYCAEYRDLFVYFDSWQDLKHKIATTDYQALSDKIKKRAQQHRADMIQRWASVFQACQLAYTS